MDLYERSMALARRPGQRATTAAIAGACAVWAGVVSRDTAHPAHHLWGLIATSAYLLCLGAAVVLPRRFIGPVVAAVGLIGAVLVPLLLLAARADYQSEVGVVQRSGALLLRTGTGYVRDPHSVRDYDPYLPGMSLYGLPHQLLDGRVRSGSGGLLLRVAGDARVWLAVVFTICLVLSWRLLRRDRGRPQRRWADLMPLLVLFGSPVVALPLCVSGVDLPIVGFTCLALACAGRERHGGLVGLLSAGACALKWTAWPLLPVAVVLVAMRRGIRHAIVCAVTGVLWGAVTILPAALRDPQALVNQVVRFPLGLAAVRTPAMSPLVGPALSQLVPAGRAVDLALLLLSLLAVSWWTLRRRPRTAVQAANRLAVGLSAMFLFAPASRFGYFLLPAVLWALTHLAAGSVALPRLPRLPRLPLLPHLPRLRGRGPVAVAASLAVALPSAAELRWRAGVNPSSAESMK